MNARSQPSPSQHEAIEAMAAAWLAQRDEGLSAGEQADFERWRQADPRHAAAVVRLEQAWAALQQLREFRPESRVHPDRDLLAGARPRAKIIPFPAVALAGLAAVLVLALVLGRSSRSAGEKLAPEPQVYATTAEGYQRVMLEDGSVLELNADSEVRVDYTAAERHVQLGRGEAHFTVTKNKARPFIVQADTVAVRAVGTAFNVRLNERDVEVLVTEGRVKVEQRAATAAPPAPLPELGMGQRLVVPIGTGPKAAPPGVESLPPESVQESLAWLGPWLRFTDTPLARVIDQFNHHNRVQIELGDPGLADLPVVGSFRAENVEAFIRLLESNGTIRVERASRDRIILRRVP